MGRLQVRRLDIGFCPLCGRAATWVENARKLQDGTIICGECVRKLRVMHPYPQDPKDSNKDPLKNLTVQQAMEAMGKVTAFIENFREHFDYRFAVFTVNRINKEGGGLFKAPVHHLYGRVLYGSFSTHDDAMVKHQGNLYACRLQSVQLMVPFGDSPTHSVNHVEAGYPALIAIQERNIDINVGDLIVK